MKILLSIFCLFVYTITASQSIGIKSGQALSNIHMNLRNQLNMPANDFLMAFHVGVYSNINLNKKLRLVPEIQFIQRGCRSNTQPNKIQLNYLELPIILSYVVFKNFRIEAGPSVSLKLSDNLNSPTDLYSNYDYGLNLGCSIQPMNRLEAFTRFYYGTHAIIKTEARDASNVSIGIFKASNLSYQIGVRYLLFDRS